MQGLLSYNDGVRIYTGGGDGGDTSLFGGGRVPKDDLRVEAYGAVDELNACLGAVVAVQITEPLRELVVRLQEELFELGADLATPPDTSARADRVVRLGEDAVKGLEAEIDRLDAQLPPLTTFILPGGSPAGAHLHLARTVARRAERRLVELARTETVSEHAIPYLNRLSDLLFVLARAANRAANAPEHLWTPQ